MNVILSEMNVILSQMNVYTFIHNIIDYQLTGKESSFESRLKRIK